LLDAISISEKLIGIASKQMNRGLKEAHDGLKTHNAKLIKTAFLNATACRWKFSRISKHWSSDPQHQGEAFEAFIDECKTCSKDYVSEMEKLMSPDLQNEIADKALEDYSNSLEDLMKRSMTRYTNRLEKGKISCIMNQVKKGIDESKAEMDELKDKFKKETENSFETQMEKYLEKMNIIESTITGKYESCYNTDDFESCLENFVQV
jgi:hypothetical protein